MNPLRFTFKSEPVWIVAFSLVPAALALLVLLILKLFR